MAPARAMISGDGISFYQVILFLSSHGPLNSVLKFIEDADCDNLLLGSFCKSIKVDYCFPTQKLSVV